MKARNRPPRLDVRPTIGAPMAVPAPTVAELLARARVAGPVTNPGPRELRHSVERLDVNPVETWAVLRAVFGTTPDEPRIDPDFTVHAARVAAASIGAVARAGGQLVFATAQPASLLGVHTALASRARAAGGTVDDSDDVGPLRIDGRAPRWLRWFDGVAVVTDGASLLATNGADAAEEWLFLAGRPVIVVADGPFAIAAVEAGLDVVAFAGLDRVELAVSAASARGCLVVPVHSGRPARAYSALVALLEDAFGEDSRTSGPEL